MLSYAIKVEGKKKIYYGIITKEELQDGTLDRRLVEQCIKNVREAGLEDRILVIEGDFFDFDLSEATVVTLYLLTTVNEKLRPKLEKELRPGARVVSHDFEIVGWKPKASKSINESYRSHKIYLYQV